MITLLLCIIISCTLNFDGLTLLGIFNWFNGHPFLAIIALSEFLSWIIIFSGSNERK